MAGKIKKVADALSTKSFVADPRTGKPIELPKGARMNRAQRKSSEYGSGTIRDGVGSRIFDKIVDKALGGK